MLQAILTIDESAAALFDCLQSESHALERAQVRYRLEKGMLIIEMTASDATALRACMSTVTRLLTVFDKVARYDPATKASKQCVHG